MSRPAHAEHLTARKAAVGAYGTGRLLEPVCMCPNAKDEDSVHGQDKLIAWVIEAEDAAEAILDEVDDASDATEPDAEALARTSDSCRNAMQQVLRAAVARDVNDVNMAAAAFEQATAHAPHVSRAGSRLPSVSGSQARADAAALQDPQAVETTSALLHLLMQSRYVALHMDLERPADAYLLGAHLRLINEGAFQSVGYKQVLRLPPTKPNATTSSAKKRNSCTKAMVTPGLVLDHLHRLCSMLAGCTEYDYDTSGRTMSTGKGWVQVVQTLLDEPPDQVRTLLVDVLLSDYRLYDDYAPLLTFPHDAAYTTLTCPLLHRKWWSARGGPHPEEVEYRRRLSRDPNICFSLGHVAMGVVDIARGPLPIVAKKRKSSTTTTTRPRNKAQDENAEVAQGDDDVRGDGTEVCEAVEAAMNELAVDRQDAPRRAKLTEYEASVDPCMRKSSRIRKLCVGRLSVTFDSSSLGAIKTSVAEMVSAAKRGDDDDMDMATVLLKFAEYAVEASETLADLQLAARIAIKYLQHVNATDESDPVVHALVTSLQAAEAVLGKEQSSGHHTERRLQTVTSWIAFALRTNASPSEGATGPPSASREHSNECHKDMLYAAKWATKDQEAADCSRESYTKMVDATVKKCLVRAHELGDHELVAREASALLSADAPGEHATATMGIVARMMVEYHLLLKAHNVNLDMDPWARRLHIEFQVAEAASCKVRGTRVGTHMLGELPATASATAGLANWASYLPIVHDVLIEHNQPPPRMATPIVKGRLCQYRFDMDATVARAMDAAKGDAAVLMAVADWILDESIKFGGDDMPWFVGVACILTVEGYRRIHPNGPNLNRATKTLKTRMAEAQRAIRRLVDASQCPESIKEAAEHVCAPAKEATTPVELVTLAARQARFVPTQYMGDTKRTQAYIVNEFVQTLLGLACGNPESLVDMVTITHTHPPDGWSSKMRLNAIARLTQHCCDWLGFDACDNLEQFPMVMRLYDVNRAAGITTGFTSPSTSPTTSPTTTPPATPPATPPTTPTTTPPRTTSRRQALPRAPPPPATTATTATAARSGDHRRRRRPRRRLQGLRLHCRTGPRRGCQTPSCGPGAHERVAPDQPASLLQV